jgi:chaperonin GroES
MRQVLKHYARDAPRSDGAAILAPEAALIGVAEKPVPKATYAPIKDLCVIHVFPQEKSEGGLVLPDGTRTLPHTPRAIVLAAGPDCKCVKVGDVVLLNEVVAAHVRHCKQETFVLQEIQFLGIEAPIDGDCVKCGAKHHACKHGYGIEPVVTVEIDRGPPSENEKKAV